ncbi:uncharacterized protein LOC103281072 [Anolis carolinensis]|uniref:uncharacterized protein LOC103281072 n=1 Tax=Anolis carolinensis TaxID=28377 RepID=UPI000462810D|nr:PREDICTED: uncharacterized protein LOC103281072 [Anolis carolinensis]|eukprot:XP_016853331.1 PREDICTED: uncharacterized protein LOC103281072 [Anolis carolinensis]
MAAVVAGLARLLQPAMALPGGGSGGQGLAPWYLLLGLRLVALFIADGPWSSTQPDLACNWTLADVNAQPFCSALCFNQHFSSPVSSMWGFAFLAALLPVGLMKLIRAGQKHERKVARAADEELTDSIGLRQNMAAGIKTAAGSAPTPTMTAFKTDPPSLETKTPCTWRSVAFVFCVILLLAMEVCFLWAVILLQLPSVSETTFLCLPGAQTCPKALECAVAGQADKQVALWALAFTAIVDIAACLTYLFLKAVRLSPCHRK